MSIPRIIRPAITSPFASVFEEPGEAVGGGGGGSSLLTGLQGWWDLLGGNAVQIDSSPNGNDLTPNNTPGQAVSGAPDGANCADLELDNSESYSITDAAQTGLSPGSGDFSVSIFARPESFPASGMFVVSKYLSSGGSREWVVSKDADGTWKFSIYKTDDSGITALGPSATLNQFACLQAYIDQSAGEIGIRVDGGAFATSVFTGDVNTTAAAFSIGDRGASGGNDFDGRESMCGVWNRVLTVSEFDTLYNSGSGARYPWAA